MTTAGNGPSPSGLLRIALTTGPGTPLGTGKPFFFARRIFNLLGGTLALLKLISVLPNSHNKVEIPIAVTIRAVRVRIEARAHFGDATLPILLLVRRLIPVLRCLREFISSLLDGEHQLFISSGLP